jgi:hypothetical protein
VTTDDAPTPAPAETPAETSGGPARPNPAPHRRRPRPTDSVAGVATVTLPTVEITPLTADDNWPTPQMRAGVPRRTATRARAAEHRRPPRKPRGPVVGLVALLVLAPLAGFVAWVSADPFWLAVGHSQRGTATITTCAGHGFLSRCTGTFSTTGFTVNGVALSPVPSRARVTGAQVTATMVSARGRLAYAGSTRALYLRLALGLALVVLCGFGIAFATGAARLPGRGARTGAYSLSLAAPLLLAAGIVAAAW